MPVPSDISIPFTSDVATTILDKDDQGTGLTTILTNTNGDQDVKAGRDLITSSGVLVMNAYTGTVGATNTAKNIIGSLFDASGGYTFELHARIYLSSSTGFANAAVNTTQVSLFVGSFTNNIKFSLEKRSGTGLPWSMHLNNEYPSGTVTDVGTIVNVDSKAKGASQKTYVDMYLTCNPTTNKVRAQWQFNGDSGRGTIDADVDTSAFTSTFFKANQFFGFCTIAGSATDQVSTVAFRYGNYTIKYIHEEFAITNTAGNATMSGDITTEGLHDFTAPMSAGAATMSGNFLVNLVQFGGVMEALYAQSSGSATVRSTETISGNMQADPAEMYSVFKAYNNVSGVMVAEAATTNGYISVSGTNFSGVMVASPATMASIFFAGTEVAIAGVMSAQSASMSGLINAITVDLLMGIMQADSARMNSVFAVKSTLILSMGTPSVLPATTEFLVNAKSNLMASLIMSAGPATCLVMTNILPLDNDWLAEANGVIYASTERALVFQPAQGNADVFTNNPTGVLT